MLDKKLDGAILTYMRAYCRGYAKCLRDSGKDATDKDKEHAVHAALNDLVKTFRGLGAEISDNKLEIMHKILDIASPDFVKELVDGKL